MLGAACKLAHHGESSLIECKYVAMSYIQYQLDCRLWFEKWVTVIRQTVEFKVVTEVLSWDLYQCFCPFCLRCHGLARFSFPEQLASTAEITMRCSADQSGLKN